MEAPPNPDNSPNHSESFKKPVLIGKVGKLPKKSAASNPAPPPDKPTDVNVVEAEPVDVPVTEDPTKEQVSLDYVEPTWSGLPTTEKPYVFEVLKSGTIIEKFNLMKKPFWVFGRLNTADIVMAHPTVSRYHAVLQFKDVASADMPIGFYIYDLGSTHGTFLNKSRIKSKMFVRMQVGHMLRIGCSSRSMLLTGPDDDAEAESELSVTELKRKRMEELLLREEEAAREKLRAEKELEDQKKRDEERGIDWGMGEDADETTDLAENPFAKTANEELYLEDPKKALRGFMEREGLELTYDCTEQGLGQFLCRVTLPIDDARGRSLVAEALVKGKKKEAVIQCALEACRILDRHGVLRQATHESRKRKAKNWEENDYYDSDEDTFLDRTGTIERKREKRMQSKVSQQPETYQTLCAKEQKLSEQIQTAERQLQSAQRQDTSGDKSDDVDTLDSYMNELNENKPDKYTIAKLKTELARLRKEHVDIVKLVNIARPAHLPALQPVTMSDAPSGSKGPSKKALPMFGKRLKVKVTLPARPEPAKLPSDSSEEESDEEKLPKEDKSSEMMQHLETKMLDSEEKVLSSLDDKVKAKISKTVTKLRKMAEEEENIVVEEKRLAVQKRKIIDLVNGASTMAPERQVKLSNALDRMTDELCVIGDRRIKMVEKINKLADEVNNIALEIKAVAKAHHEEAVNKMKHFVEKAHNQQVKIFNELKNIEKSISDPQVMDKLKELYDWLINQKNNMMESLEKLKNTKITRDCALIDEIMEFESKSEVFISTILEEIDKIRKRSDCDAAVPSGSKSEDADTSEKKKKKNQRRTQLRVEKAEQERKKQYEEDASKEDYNMWVPPQNQTGDGRTNLNEKYGY